MIVRVLHLLRNTGLNVQQASCMLCIDLLATLFQHAVLGLSQAPASFTIRPSVVLWG